MGAKLKHIEDPKPGEPDYIFDCPACKCSHGVWTTSRNGNNAIWNFNGNVNVPSISPSINVTIKADGGKILVSRCHSVITNGMINYCGDCTHEYAGKQIPLPDFDSI